MRIALFSDIHGNLVALETVLAELAQESTDHIVCLGDVVEGGPEPRAVLERLQRLGCPIVMGNTDARMSSARLGEPRTPDLPPAYARELWCVDQLTPADRTIIQTFPLTISVPLNHDMALLGFHGSPHNNRELLFATTPDSELAHLLQDARANILAGGHTHVQMVRRYQDMIIVNPGSVGLPFEQPVPDGPIRRPHWAEYALVSVRRGHVSIDLRRTPIPIDALLDGVAKSGMPYPEQWIQDWL